MQRNATAGSAVLDEELARGLEYAKLAEGDLRWDFHPDSGESCLVLEATVQQYGRFLVALTWQGRDAGAIATAAQMETRQSGDTWFWLPGLETGRS